MDWIRRAGSSATRIVAIALVIVGLALNVFLIYQRLFSTFQVVQGSSMAPTINGGDAIVLKDVDTKNIVVGQVIVFRDWEAKDQFVVHRVVQIEDDGYTRLFTTKGDNNPGEDPVKTPSGGVVGAVLVHLPVVGPLLKYLSTIRGFTCGVVVPILGGLLLSACRPRLTGSAGTAAQARSGLIRQPRDSQYSLHSTQRRRGTPAALETQNRS